MRAVVYHSPKNMKVDEVDNPTIQDDRDIILKVSSTAICGSDLHLYNGTFPQARPMVMGHEFMGTVEELGPGVHNLQKGDRVIVPFPIACGECWFCQHKLPTQCENSNPEHYGPEGKVLDEKGGALFGYSDLYGGVSGGQAEYVRVPYGDYGPRKVPDNLSDEQVLFLTDILPTGYTAIDWAEVRGGETVAVFGCGPVGLMAQKAAWVRGAARVIGLDVYDYRLEMAKKVANSETLNIKDEEAIEKIRSMTDGRGADVCVDAVGMEADISGLRKAEAAMHLEAGTIQAFSQMVSAARRGGTISVVGVYGTSYDNFPWGQIFDKGLHIHTGQAPVQKYVDELLEMIVNGKIRADDIITHILPLDEAPRGYEIFNNKEDNCVKIVLKP